jgi:hypothetical protein
VRAPFGVHLQREGRALERGGGVLPAGVGGARGELHVALRERDARQAVRPERQQHQPARVRAGVGRVLDGPAPGDPRDVEDGALAQPGEVRVPVRVDRQRRRRADLRRVVLAPAAAGAVLEQAHGARRLVHQDHPRAVRTGPRHGAPAGAVEDLVAEPAQRVSRALPRLAAGAQGDHRLQDARVGVEGHGERVAGRRAPEAERDLAGEGTPRVGPAGRLAGWQAGGARAVEVRGPASAAPRGIARSAGRVGWAEARAADAPLPRRQRQRRWTARRHRGSLAPKDEARALLVRAPDQWAASRTSPRRDPPG